MLVAQQSVGTASEVLDLTTGRESLAIVGGPATVVVLGGHASHGVIDPDYQVKKAEIVKPDGTVKIAEGTSQVFSSVAGGIRLSIERG